MIVILADDFSGAAELAGIAAARGLRAEVRTRFDASHDADLVAIDTDTRALPEADAARVVGEIAREIAAVRPDWIYKKTDSVLRAHVRAEIEAVLAATGLGRCLLLPANPSKGRVITGGHYLIDGVPLSRTLFADDPAFPARVSRVRDLLGECPRILTPDLDSVDDLPTAIPPDTLAAGAADYFTALLGDRPVVTRRESPARVLLVSGSLAAWDSGRRDDMRTRGFLVKTLDDPVSPDIWEHTDRVLLAIGRPESGDPSRLTDRLIDRAAALVGDHRDLRLAIEGGATAIACLRRLGWDRFEVIPENHPGVGSLRPPGGPLLSVKPGSYPWPESLFPPAIIPS